MMLFVFLLGVIIGAELMFLWRAAVEQELDERTPLSRDYGYDSATGERSAPR